VGSLLLVSFSLGLSNFAAGIGIGRYAGAGLLILTGLYAIGQGRRSRAAGRRRRGHETLKTTQLVLAAAALSIDNLIVGFALGVRQVPILVAAAIVAPYGGVEVSGGCSDARPRRRVDLDARQMRVRLVAAILLPARHHSVLAEM
jgi:putative Mn2+ efflux pump MntP